MMVVLYVDDNETWRNNVRTALGVSDDNQVAGSRYVGTGSFEAAKTFLSRNEVQVLILDLGLNVKKDNQEKLGTELKKAVTDPDWKAPHGMEAYQLALLARRHRAAVAVLTNYATQLGMELGTVLAGLARAFAAKAAFPKGEQGLKDCATWVHQQLSRAPRRA
jgi:hypothetical protein